MKKMVTVMGLAFVIICGIMLVGCGANTEEVMEDEMSYGEIAYAYACLDNDNVDKVTVDNVYVEDGNEYISYVVYENGSLSELSSVKVSYAQQQIMRGNS